jgi:hypothetical protein
VSVRATEFLLWTDYLLFGRIRLLIAALITVAAVTLLLTAISFRLSPSHDAMRDHGRTLEARIEGLTNSLNDAARLISEINQEITRRQQLEEKLQRDAQEAKQASELKPEQEAAVAQALREELQNEGRSGFWYTVLANLFFALVGAGISELFRLYRRWRILDRSKPEN